MRGWSPSTCFFALFVLLAAPETRAQDTGGRFYGDRVVRCESKGGRRTFARPTSAAACACCVPCRSPNATRARTWGVMDAGIWVRDGCRAEFVLGYGGTVGSAYGSRTIRCESRGNRWQHCDADTSAGAELVRQLSKNPCINGDNWGVDNRGVWVSGGCRAEFRMMAVVSRRVDAWKDRPMRLDRQTAAALPGRDRGRGGAPVPAAVACGLCRGSQLGCRRERDLGRGRLPCRIRGSPQGRPQRRLNGRQRRLTG